MDRNDQQAIETLFDKIAQVERQSPPRDREAEAFIRERMTAQPGAPYYMAQTIVVQQAALEAAQARIEELERQPAKGLFGTLFGDSRPVARPSYDRQGEARRSSTSPQGGGFLAGAAQTAMGVAGGVLIANAIGGLFGAGQAEAGQQDQAAGEAEAGDAGYDAGGDFGDIDL
jgi:uncharacterized protein